MQVNVLRIDVAIHTAKRDARIECHADGVFHRLFLS